MANEDPGLFATDPDETQPDDTRRSPCCDALYWLTRFCPVCGKHEMYFELLALREEARPEHMRKAA